MSERKRRKRHTPEQVIAKLREADAMLSAGALTGLVLQALRVSEATLGRWRQQYDRPRKTSVARR